MPPNKISGIIKSDCPSVRSFIRAFVRSLVRPLKDVFKVCHLNFTFIWGHLSLTATQFLFHHGYSRTLYTIWSLVRRRVTLRLTRLQTMCNVLKISQTTLKRCVAVALRLRLLFNLLKNQYCTYMVQVQLATDNHPCIVGVTICCHETLHFSQMLT